MPMAIDLSRCDGCGICEALCPGDIIYMRLRTPDDPAFRFPAAAHAATGTKVRKRRRHSRVAYLKYASECWHCGSCRQDCPQGAITPRFPPDMLCS
jgi:NAD-dependent dihydropyrimidine dehydrogenase PreA subunit